MSRRSDQHYVWQDRSGKWRARWIDNGRVMNTDQTFETRTAAVRWVRSPDRYTEWEQRRTARA